jgi:hypothetical protein
MKTRIINRSWNVIVFLLFFGFLISANISSAATIDFGIRAGYGSDNGTIVYEGGVLSGTNIEVDEVSVPGYSPPTDLTNGVLNFTSHLVAFSNALGIDTWIFGGDGTISIRADGYSEPLMSMSGTWDSGVVIKLLNLPGGGILQVLNGSFTDEKNEEWLDSLGLGAYGNDEFAGGINLQFASTITDAQLHEFRSTVIYSGDVTNTPAPIPGAVVLLGGGLLGLIGIRRRL